MKIVQCLFGAALAFGSCLASAAMYQGDPWPRTLIGYNIDNDLSNDAENEFLAAVSFFNDQTGIQWVPASSPEYDPNWPVVNVRALRDENGDRVSGGGATITGYRGDQEPVHHISLGDSIDRGLAVHEMLHVLGFSHEHVRADREDSIYVDIDETSSSYDSHNNPLPLYDKQLFGAVDYYSSSFYPRSYYSPKYDSYEIHDLLLKDVDYDREFIFRLDDGVTESLPDLDGIHTENGALEVSSARSFWWSAHWRIERQSNSRYTLQNRWTGDYLINQGGSVILDDDRAVTGNAGDSEWFIFRVDSTLYSNFQVCSTTNACLQKTNGSLTLAPYWSENSSWKIQAPFKPLDYTLSPLDRVTLHWAYGFDFRIRISDGTASTTDNPALHVQDTRQDKIIDAETLPTTNGENGWFSAMWYFEHVDGTKYVKIRNKWTGAYIHMEQGPVRFGLPNEVNHLNDNIQYWHSAQWLLEPAGDHIRIKNRWTDEYLTVSSSELSSCSDRRNCNTSWQITRVEDGQYF